MSSRQVILNQPYYSQLNNDSDSNSGPWNECSYSAMACVLGGCGLVGNGYGQFDDQIERAYEARGLQRGAPYDMEHFMNDEYGHLGVHAEYEPHGTLDMVLEALQEGKGVVLHTDLTPSGHVVAVDGFDLDAYRGSGALILLDPNGEWFPTGYRQDKTGRHVYLSFPSVDRYCGPDGNYWMHKVWRE